MHIYWMTTEWAEVSCLLRLAQLDSDNLKAETQTIAFSNPLYSDDFRLIELDDQLIECIRNGDNLTIRGLASDHPVLCSETRSYLVKEAQISNTLILMPKCHLGQQVVSDGDGFLQPQQAISMTSRYMELRPIGRIKTARLCELLQENLYNGSDPEYESVGKFYDMTDLLDRVQASRFEIEQSLLKMPVCQIDGSFRWLAFEYRSKLLSNLIETCENGHYPGLSEEFLLDSALRKYFLENDTAFSVVDWFIRTFCVSLQENDLHHCFNKESVSRFYAESILRTTKSFNYKDFFIAWNRTLPISINPDEKFLTGLALIESTIRGRTIQFFPIQDLPDDPQQRFDILFRQRSRWSYDQICPYLVDLTSSDKEIGTLLTKFCRNTTIEGRKMYNSRDSGYAPPI